MAVSTNKKYLWICVLRFVYWSGKTLNYLYFSLHPPPTQLKKIKIWISGKLIAHTDQSMLSNI